MILLKKNIEYETSIKLFQKELNNSENNNKKKFEILESKILVLEKLNKEDYWPHLKNCINGLSKLKSEKKDDNKIIETINEKLFDLKRKEDKIEFWLKCQQEQDERTFVLNNPNLQNIDVLVNKINSIESYIKGIRYRVILQKYTDTKDEKYNPAVYFYEECKNSYTDYLPDVNNIVVNKNNDPNFYISSFRENLEEKIKKLNNFENTEKSLNNNDNSNGKN